MITEDKKDVIRSVDHAIDILQTFSFDEMELSLAEICARIDLPKTTIYRNLVTLERRNLLSVNSQNGKYRLGYEMIRLGVIAQDSNTL